MGKDDNIKKLTDFFISKVPLEEMYEIYKRKNILFERLNHIQDFYLLINKYIFSTYLGKESIKSKKDIEGHFNWCLQKTIEDFDKIGIKYKDTTEIYDYLYEFYKNEVYYNELPINEMITKKMILNLTSFHAEKRRLVLEDTLILYEMFNKNFLIKKQNNIEIFL